MTNLSLWLKLPISIAKLIPSSELDSDDYTVISTIHSFSLKETDKIDNKILTYILSISIKESLKLIRKGIESLQQENDLRRIRQLSRILRVIYQEVNDIVFMYHCNREQREFFCMVKVYIEKQQVILYKLSSINLLNRKRIVV